MKIYPYAALHVAVTEVVFSRIRPFIHIWYKNWREEACKVEWLHMSSSANDSDRTQLINAIREAYGEGSMAHRAALDLNRLCIERYKIEQRDRYYKSMHAFT